MNRSTFLNEASHLLELSVDKITEGGEGELTCKVTAKRENRVIERRVTIPAYLRKEWAMIEGSEFTHIYTDGSYKEEATWEEQLLGTVKEQAGGAIILSDGASWIYKISVSIDIEVEDA